MQYSMFFALVCLFPNISYEKRFHNFRNIQFSTNIKIIQDTMSNTRHDELQLELRDYNG